MFSRMVLGHNHQQSTGTDFIDLRLHPYSATHPLIRRIIASHFCIAVGFQQFRKESKNLLMRIKFERYYFFFHYCVLSCR